MALIGMQVADGRVLKLIQQTLAAGYQEEGGRHEWSFIDMGRERDSTDPSPRNCPVHVCVQARSEYFNTIRRFQPCAARRVRSLDVETNRQSLTTSSLSDLAPGRGLGRIDGLIRSWVGWARLSNFRTIDRQTGFLLPPSVDEWLPERHLARFVVEVIDGLDLRAMSGDYR